MPIVLGGGSRGLPLTLRAPQPESGPDDMDTFVVRINALEAENKYLFQLYKDVVAAVLEGDERLDVLEARWRDRHSSRSETDPAPDRA